MSGLAPLTARELKKWYRNPVFLLTGLIQPFFWLALFGSAIDISKFLGGGAATSAAAGVIFQGASNYITFILGGILVITSLFTAMFSGVNIIFDRRLGPMGRFLTSPIRRSSIVFSKILSAMVRILVQVVILIAAAFVIPNGLVLEHGFSLLAGFVMVVTVILVALIFSSIFSVIAVRLKDMNTIFGIVNLVNLPLLFMSYAMFPPDIMASWLADAAKYNPVSWAAESIRTVVINGTVISSQVANVEWWMGSLAILAAGLVLLTYFVAEKEIRD